MPPEFLTQEGYDKLAEELEHLRTVRRKEVAERLHEAAEASLGEFVEDPEFEAAKNEQSFVEGRIRELEVLLANAQVIAKRRKKGGRGRPRSGGRVADVPDQGPPGIGLRAVGRGPDHARGPAPLDARRR